ncbi:unnamed protein product [Linum tenue]|uniref:F-box domain-containing protein n=1 Tax=Linum tenue TaxID=586396 RepID=A0AAV0JDR6_9ROSI|nr:unnamed protein product [Linum tenue]
MADWSQLPSDLLERISKRLDTATEILRFRSVCNSWRSSASPYGCRLSRAFQILPSDDFVKTSIGFYLSKRTVYLIGLPDSRHLGGRLVKIEEDIPNRKRLLNPLSRYPLKSLPENFPRLLDLREVFVKELGQEYVLRHIGYMPNSSSFADAGDQYMEKVAMMWLDPDSQRETSEFVLLTTHLSGKLAIFSSADRKWTITGETGSPYDNVIVHKGKLLAVDNTGKVVSVSKDADLTLVANPVFGGDKKYLVQSSKDQLLLVDMYLSIDTGEENFDIGEEFMGHLAQYMRERKVRFKVYRLDGEEKTWVELGSLGDTVLFIGDDSVSAFAASSSDLYGCKGNCIFFVDDFYYGREIGGLGEEDGMWVAGDIGVFELDTGSIGPLVNYPEYYKIFWQPPGRLLSPPSEVVDLEKQAEGLSL